MSRSGYSEDIDDMWSLICYRGAVAQAIRGRRGQALLKEMLAVLEALPSKRLIEMELETKDGEVCALGAVGKVRGIDMSSFSGEDDEAPRIAKTFGIATALAREIMWMNDEDGPYNQTPEGRYQRVLRWVREHIRGDNADPAAP